MSHPKRAICLFEDHTVSHFIPLVYTRPVFDLRCGVHTLREKTLSYYPGAPSRLWCRDNLKDVVQERNPGTSVNILDDTITLYINGRVLMDDALARVLTADGPDCMFLQGDTLIAARVHDSQWPLLSSGSSAGSVVRATMEQVEVKARLVNYIWDLVRLNGEEIVHDFSRMTGRHGDFSRFRKAHLINERDMTVGADVDILPGAVLDASDGPIIIGSHTRIMPHSYIQGPVCVGEHAIIQAGSHIYGGATIGPVCKVGGEVASSIIHGYSNKQHHGFLGHAYVGQWVNIGAGTTNSNLKNTYGTISMKLGGGTIDTGMTFLGVFMGDFTKAAINTSFNTGTVVGFCSNVVSAGFPPKYIPPFTWLTPEGSATFHLTKALEVAQRMMARRQVTMSPTETGRFVQVYGETAQERSRMFDTATMG